MSYSPNEIDKKWQEYWKKNETYRIREVDMQKPKYYVLDMFPYPSGAGLHVGHPLGYIATDIFSRYKRMCGFNVLHPMGFDSFGLPAEQYAIQTGKHPADTTEENINRYKSQLKSIGFDYDWSREVRTSDPNYYKWTQWIFLKLFGHYYDINQDKARPIEELENYFKQHGSEKHPAAGSKSEKPFTAEEWNKMGDAEKQNILMHFRLAFQTYSDVNWCPELGTVLANDEVKEGLSVRGGHPVEKKSMRQWFLRITAYAERLLNDLETLDWTDSLKEMQRNWIGKSEGATVFFELQNHPEKLEIYTTRPDTIFGATFMVLAPEHPLVEKLTTNDNKNKVENYIQKVKSRSERERLSEVDRVSGEFTGAYAVHPFSGKPIPVWIADYVLMGYGSGAIMAVPSDDERDYAFANQYNLEIIDVVKKNDNQEIGDKYGTLINSDFLNGLEVKDAIRKIISELEKRQIGFGKINYRMRDAGFSRQRYWGEPFPIVYKNSIPHPLSENALPVKLPEVKSYTPTGTGESPLAAVKEWVYLDKDIKRETDTMPGYAGSSWYFLRYMDAANQKHFAGEAALNYWQDVDLYVGGAEHAVGHLMYARFWHKFMHDLGLVPTIEPFKKLINQGMIQGRSNLVFKRKSENTFISADKLDAYLEEQNLIKEDVISLHVDVNIVKNDVLDVSAFEVWKRDYKGSKYITNSDGDLKCDVVIEKMSKSLFNVVKPNDIISEYGADVFRMYEMFLGPVELHKPWNTNGIDGVAKFLRKFWRLFHTEEGKWAVEEGSPKEEELKILHKTIKKVREDIESFSFNTAVSAFMILVNDLSKAEYRKKAILEQVVLLIAPFAPHISEELWEKLGHQSSVCKQEIPNFDETYLKENSFEYPVSINGKMRTKITLDIALSKEDVEKEVLSNEVVQKWLEGKSPKKIIYVPQRILNVVV